MTVTEATLTEVTRRLVAAPEGIVQHEGGPAG